MGILNFLVGHFKVGPPRKTDWGGAWAKKANGGPFGGGPLAARWEDLQLAAR